MKAFTKLQWTQLVIVWSMVFASVCVAQDDKTASDHQKLDRKLNRISRTPTAAEGFEAVEMFEAMEKGDIKVRFVPKNANSSNLFVENLTNRPLSIQMPATFSAVPAMRLQGQLGMGGGAMGGPGMGGGNMGGGNMGGMGGQGMGGGMGMGGMGMGGMGGMGMGGMGMGGGMFNIPVGRKGKLQLNTVCLEEGRPDPKPTIEYVIQPLEKLNADPRIAEICMMLGNNEISTEVAQAAAWHVSDNLSWQELMVKNRRESMDGSFERYFHPMQLQFAERALTVANQRIAMRATQQKNQNRSGDYNQIPTVAPAQVNR
jgi:hypothetical protein